MAAVSVESLTITYGSVRAVQDLSFGAEAGEVTCVLGPNGAGKTSTIEALEGLRRPARGRLSVLGLEPRADHRALAEKMGVMLQEGGLHPGLRPLEALRHAAALYRHPLRPEDLLDRLGLAGRERRTTRQLSGGEQRRLALAVALVGRPQVAFLDEPTAGVDPQGRQVIRQVIADLRREGVTVVLTTHDLDEAERVADRVVIVDGGRLVADRTLDDLLASGSGGDQVRFRAAPGLAVASLADHLGGGATVTETAPGEYLVAAPPTPAVVAAITAWLADRDLALADLRAGRQRLEDVYLALTGAAAEAEPTTSEPTGAAEPAGSEPAGAAGSNAEPTASAEPDDGAEPTAARPTGAEPTAAEIAAISGEPGVGETSAVEPASPAAAEGESGGRP
ncbi:MAG TPA: ATP-binding cassette domain-containing protein [Acidimicrobiales bacterium]